MVGMLSTSAFFVGTADEQEACLIGVLRQTHNVLVISTAADAYQHIAEGLPQIIMFAAGACDTDTLKLFRRLRRVSQVCAIVCSTSHMEAFAGRNHSRRRRVSKNVSGLLDLLEWAQRSQRFLSATAQGSSGVLQQVEPLASQPIQHGSEVKPQPSLSFWSGLFSAVARSSH